MSKEEYIEQKEVLIMKIEQIKAQIKNLDKEYIEANKKFESMDIVEITTPAREVTNLFTGMKETLPENKRMGIVVENYIDWENNVVPFVKKMKKDGTMSKNKDYIMQDDILKKTGIYLLAEN